MKLRSFFSVLVATVVVLLSIGLGGFYWITAHNPLSLLERGGQASPTATMFVPKQAPVMVSLLVNPDRLESFRLAIANPGERRRARAELEELKQNLLSKRGLDYKQDIQPWLGDEVTLSVTTPDFDRDDGNGRQPGYLLAIASRDPQRSREFLQLFWQKQAVAGVDLVFEQYAGVKIIYGSEVNPNSADDSKLPSISDSQPPVPTLASAVVGDRFVLFANHPKVLRDAINNVQAPGLSLKNSSEYQQALRRLPSQQVGAIFVNLPELRTWLRRESGSAPSTPPLEEPSSLYESLLIGLELDRQGILADTALLTAPGQTIPVAKPALSKPVAALQFIPADSSLSAAGTNLAQLWEQLSTGFADNGLLSALIAQPLTNLQTSAGVDLAEDLFSWVKEEYVLSSIPNEIKQQPDWVFVAQRSPAAESAIEHLDAIAKQQGFSVGPLTLGDQQILAWTKLSTAASAKRKKNALTLQADVQGVHGAVGDYEIFATSVEAMDKALHTAKNSLLTAPDYKQAIAPLGSPNDGYLYIDWQTAHTVLEQQVPLLQLAELTAKPFFEHLRSLTFSSYGSEETLRRGAIFIRLRSS